MRLFSKVSSQQRVDFAKSLAIMLKSGVAINEALDELAHQSTSKFFSRLISRVRDDIENGTALSKAFAKQEDVFGTIFVSLIKAGEESGTLQGNLQFLAEWLGRSADLEREVKSATMYPKMVFSAAIVLGGFLSAIILPKLIPLFTGLDVELPWITKTLMAISLFVQTSWLLCIVAVITSIFLVSYLNKIHFIRRFLHRFYLRVPFMGSMLKHYQLALITQLFSTLLKSGLSLNESVEIIAVATTNISYQEALMEVQKNIIKGTTFSKSLIHFETLFPRLVINIIAVGERSGTLTNSFEYLTEYYTKEVNAETKRLPSVVEPLLLVFIAIVVGFVALAIIMPIYSLTGNISR